MLSCVFLVCGNGVLWRLRLFERAPPKNAKCSVNYDLPNFPKTWHPLPPTHNSHQFSKNLHKNSPNCTALSSQLHTWTYSPRDGARRHRSAPLQVTDGAHPRCSDAGHEVVARPLLGWLRLGLPESLAVDPLRSTRVVGVAAEVAAAVGRGRCASRSQVFWTCDLLGLGIYMCFQGQGRPYITHHPVPWSGYWVCETVLVHFRPTQDESYFL